MDIDKFVKKQNSALKRYRRIYILLDFAAISFILYTLFFIFNMEGVFSMVSTFELNIGSTYQLMDYSIPFETLGLVFAAVILSLIITIILHIRDKRSNVLNLVENKYPVLFERLRTAYDNRTNSNIIIDNLLTNVMMDTKTVRSSSFLNKKRLAFGIIALLATSSFFTYVTISDYRTDITPEDISKIIEELPLIKEEEKQLEGLLPEGGDDREGDESDTENLFGEPAIIVIEGEEIDLTLPPGAGIGFTGRTEGEIRTEEFERSSAYDISVISSQAYYESLPEGYHSIIKAYFEEMAQ
ncbi:MAG: hypothetical protein K0A90_09300 [Methanosarcinaceae archaeon]|nr:hypothetical protein [Methanosarcinaceae archaeon]